MKKDRGNIDEEKTIKLTGCRHDRPFGLQCSRLKYTLERSCCNFGSSLSEYYQPDG